jgi:hypothetical protein
MPLSFTNVLPVFENCKADIFYISGSAYLPARTQQTFHASDYFHVAENSDFPLLHWIAQQQITDVIRTRLILRHTMHVRGRFQRIWEFKKIWNHIADKMIATLASTKAPQKQHRRCTKRENAPAGNN